MAFDFLKLNFLSRLDARARVVVLLLSVIGVVLIVYFGTLYLLGGERATSTTEIAGPPPGLQTIPGGTMTPQYQKAMEQASIRRTELAQMRGESAIPTVMVQGEPSLSGGEPCTIVCSEKSVNVKDLLEGDVRQGKISPEISASLQKLADSNVSVDEYAAQLNQLIKEGKISPEQARDLLETYKKQHTNALLQESAKGMDDLIKSGRLPLDAANDLLIAQKSKVSPSEYSRMLQDLVRDGKISPEVAQSLLAQYTNQFSKEIIMQSIAALQQMTRAGEITPEVEKQLIQLESQMVPIDQMSKTLNDFVSAGKMVPASSKKILDEYFQQKAAIGAGGVSEEMVNNALAAAYKEISDLQQAGRITPDVANLLNDLIKRNVSLAQFKSSVDALVSQNKLTADIAKLKLNDYERIKRAMELKEKLQGLQANNVPSDLYANQLKTGVQGGVITPQDAARLMQEYLALSQRAPAPRVAALTPEFAALQEKLRQEQKPAVTPEQFAAPKAQPTPEELQETEQERRARVEALMGVMTGQAQQLINTWQPAVMEHKEGTPPPKEVPGEPGGGAPGTTPPGAPGAPKGPPLIKAGTIIFGVLDTTVNSDYPNTPVMVTIVEGKFKGAKLMGKLQTEKNVAGQLDRVSLNFTLMSFCEWGPSKPVTAYGIDPDTARTAIASRVNYHYLQRYGAIMATSFLEGYANAIATSGSTTTTGIFGTSTTHPELSPGEKLATAIGQIGTNLSTVTAKYVDIPPTVRVDSGVSLGILFMADLSET